MARSFRINYETNKFEMDGKDFQYVSGSFHYFRAFPSVYRKRLQTMRDAGLNAVDTYIEWAYHQPEEISSDNYADLISFLQIADELGLYVILRPGPYICAERDNGGIPYWLFSKYPDIKLRTSDKNYLEEVSLWFSILFPKIQDYFYGRGGPIIMVQIENEYAASKLRDHDYLIWLRDLTKKYVKDDAVLFTVDIPESVDDLLSGKIDDVLATIDFGIDSTDKMDDLFNMLRKVQPNGPLVNSEYYPGWLTHWQEQNQRRDGATVANTLKMMLERGVSVNFYMFFGGSNFGFTAGANDFGFGKYVADITSYDYDAPMQECGDPNGEKYSLIKNVIEAHFNLPIKEVPKPSLKMSLPSVELKYADDLLSNNAKQTLSKNVTFNKTPLTFEQLRQFSGLVLYESVVNIPIEIDPTVLTIDGLHDRAIILIDGEVKGILSRGNAINSMPISGVKSPFTLQILVENQGRINYNVFDDKKGIVGGVSLQRLNGKEEIFGWTMFGYPLDNAEKLDQVISSSSKDGSPKIELQQLRNGPAIFYGCFDILHNDLYDTFINPSGWGKGIIFINGFNIGRYWPLVGPQITLYVPAEILKKGQNEITFVEYQQMAGDQKVRFTDKPILEKS